MFLNNAYFYQWKWVWSSFCQHPTYLAWWNLMTGGVWILLCEYFVPAVYSISGQHKILKSDLSFTVKELWLQPKFFPWFFILCFNVKCFIFRLGYWYYTLLTGSELKCTPTTEFLEKKENTTQVHSVGTKTEH